MHNIAPKRFTIHSAAIELIDMMEKFRSWCIRAMAPALPRSQHDKKELGKGL